MASITFDAVGKSYTAGTHAIEDFSLRIEDGEFLVLVGPSGCGKTTLLRMIAGLEEISEGKILIGDRVVNDVPPKDRDIAMVFQNYALYPHMSVFDNMAFGLKLRKMPKPEIGRRVSEAARVLEITDYLDRKPRALSGGQRQRVAMGRAIVREPVAFLMDEPLSNLDAKLRVQMRTELARLHLRLSTTTVYVTHDQVEAMTLGSRVAVVRKGRLQQIDTPFRLYQEPVNLFVAGFIGSPAMNFMYAVLERSQDGTREALIPGHRIRLGSAQSARPSLESYLGREIVLGIRPTAFAPATTATAATLQAAVEVVDVLGNETYVHFNLAGRPVLTPDIEELLADTGADASTLGEQTRVTARISSDVAVTMGDRLELAIDVDKIQFFDPETSLRI